jgi:oligoribonuclease NrnB/cAMP/cGMP phosphodiesterase (DHH superfamily)
LLTSVSSSKQSVGYVIACPYHYVCKIAQKFGGGGHKTAAGTYLPGPLENAKNLINEEAKNIFRMYCITKQ